MCISSNPTLKMSNECSPKKNNPKSFREFALLVNPREKEHVIQIQFFLVTSHIWWLMLLHAKKNFQLFMVHHATSTSCPPNQNPSQTELVTPMFKSHESSAGRSMISPILHGWNHGWNHHETTMNIAFPCAWRRRKLMICCAVLSPRCRTRRSTCWRNIPGMDHPRMDWGRFESLDRLGRTLGIHNWSNHEFDSHEIHWGFTDYGLVLFSDFDPKAYAS